MGDDWCEFDDREFANWKRARAAIEHENQLINHRLTWLLVVNAAFVTAFGTLLEKAIDAAAKSTPDMQLKLTLGAIAAAGGFFSWFSSLGLLAAHKQHTELARWWNEFPYASDRTRHPPLVGTDPLGMRKMIEFHYYHIAWIFMGLWGFLFVLGLSKEAKTFFAAAQSKSDEIILVGSIFSVISLVLLLGIKLGRAYPKRPADEMPDKN